MNEPLICQVYRGSKRRDVYLYVDKKQGLSQVPEALIALMGQPELSMTILLKADKRLARLTAKELMKHIEEKGFYLQMPVLENDEMQLVAQKNNKLVK